MDNTPETMSTEADDLVWVRTSVQYPGGIDVAYQPVERYVWGGLSGEQREEYLRGCALDHQRDLDIGCDGSVVDAAYVPALIRAAVK